MPKIDQDTAPSKVGTSYPEPFRSRTGAILRRELSDAARLTQFGVNLTTLEPGKVSSMRHWHEAEDEFIWIVSGEVILVEEDAETPLRAGDAAAFKAGVANAHHLVNRSDAPATFLEIGTRAADERGHYPDDDLAYERRNGAGRFTRKDGSPIG